MPLDSKFIYDALKDHGPISRTGALELKDLEGLERFLNTEIFPKNPDPRPIGANVKFGVGRKSMHPYREKMARYVSFWIKIDHTYTVPVYETLANFAESRT